MIPEGHGVIYRLTFGNGKVYIGQTSRPFWARLNDHAILVGGNKNSKLYNGWRKHGLESADVIFVCSIRFLNEFEAHFISEYDSFDSGYNATRGGEGGPLRTPECAAKLKATLANKLATDPQFKESLSNRMSTSIKKYHSDPANKAEHRATLLRIHDDPEYKDNLKRHIANQWKDPVIRMKRQTKHAVKVNGKLYGSFRKAIDGLGIFIPDGGGFRYRLKNEGSSSIEVDGVMYHFEIAGPGF